MRRRILGAAILTGLALTMSGPAQAEISIGADMVSRYVWRGTDFGNALTVQPGIDYDAGSGVNIGAWSSWAINSGEANENDLYVSYAPTDKVSIMVTDYYFPSGGEDNEGDDFLNYASDGAHIIEAGVSVDLGNVSILGAYNVHGDDDNSFYAEIGLPLSALSSNNHNVSLAAGLGDGVYTTSGDPALAVISLNVSNDDYSASYIVNPDSELSFLVVGKSF